MIGRKTLLAIVALLVMAPASADASFVRSQDGRCSVDAFARDAAPIDPNDPYRDAQAIYGVQTNRGCSLGVRRVRSVVWSELGSKRKVESRMPYRNFKVVKNPPPGDYTARIEVAIRLRRDRFQRVGKGCRIVALRKVKCRFRREFNVRAG